jgi:anaerobic magnesium-protoporphyrin IX monomethyl ester cyclase
MTGSCEDLKLLILNLPNPPFRHVDREYAGGFGIATHSLRKWGRSPCLNLFLPYSAAVAKGANCEYAVLDTQALRMSPTKVLQETKAADPNVIISMISLPSIYHDKKLLSDIKREMPSTLIVGCGTVCKVMPKEVLSGSGTDLLINDEFPYVNGMNQLINNLQRLRQPKNFTKTTEFSCLKRSMPTNKPAESPLKKDFTDYTPIYDVLPLKKYQSFADVDGKTHQYLPILGSKGCSYSCMYCPYPIGFGRKPVFKNAKSVVDEIEHLNRVKGVEGFLFRNQSFTLSLKWAEKVCQEILDRKLDVSWSCEARTDETSERILTLMKESGCKRIHYGVETGDPRLIKIAKPGVQLENTRRAFDLTKKMGIWRHAHIILGLPGENRQSFINTLKFLLTLEPDSTTVNFATPYPGTKLSNLAEKNGWILSRDWSGYSSFDVVMRTQKLDANELYEMAEKINRSLTKQQISRFFSFSHHPYSFSFLANYLPGVVLTNLFW